MLASPHTCKRCRTRLIQVTAEYPPSATCIGNAFLPVLFMVAVLISGKPVLPQADQGHLHLPHCTGHPADPGLPPRHPFQTQQETPRHRHRLPRRPHPLPRRGRRALRRCLRLMTDQTTRASGKGPSGELSDDGFVGGGPRPPGPDEGWLSLTSHQPEAGPARSPDPDIEARAGE